MNQKINSPRSSQKNAGSPKSQGINDGTTNLTETNLKALDGSRSDIDLSAI